MKPPAPEAESRNLDVLRAVAVLLVYFSPLLADFKQVGRVGFLATPPLGTLGVMLFFVHTCLVLLRSLDRMDGGKVVSRFYLRRAFRIYPLSIFTVAVMSLLWIPPEPRFPYLVPTVRELVTNFLLIQNVVPARNLAGVLWSLPWEVQMYLVLPFLHRFLKRFPSLLTPVLLLLVTAVIRLAGTVAGIRVMTLFQFFPCFLAGAVAYRFTQVIRPRLSSQLWPLAVVSITAIGQGALQALQAGDSYVKVSLAWYLASGVAGFAIPLFSDMADSWFTRGSHLIAKYSYGIYLAHVPLMWLAFVKLAFLPGYVQWACLLITSVLVPFALYHLVEEPMIRVGRGLSTPRAVAPGMARA